MKKQVKTIKSFSTKETAQVVTTTQLNTVKGGGGQTTVVSGTPTTIDDF